MKKIIPYFLIGLLLSQVSFAEEDEAALMNDTQNMTSEETEMMTDETDILFGEDMNETEMTDESEMMDETEVMEEDKMMDSTDTMADDTKKMPMEEDKMQPAEKTTKNMNVAKAKKENTFYKDNISGKLGFGVGFGAGGFELKGVYKFNKYISTSLEYNMLELTETFNDLGGEGEDVTADGNFTISSLKALAHWHPFGGGFRLSAGYVKNLSDMTIDILGENIVLQEADASEGLEEITSNLEGQIILNTGDNLPYVGLGWGYDIEDRFAFDFAMGIQFIQKIKGSDLIDYDITMTSSALETYVDNVAAELGDSNSNYYKQLSDEGYSGSDISEIKDILETDTEVRAALASGDPFELYEVLDEKGILDKFGVEKVSKSVSKAASDNAAFSSLPNPDDYIAEMEDEIDNMVEETGLGAIQDIFGFAPIPVVSLGVTVFLW